MAPDLSIHSWGDGPRSVLLLHGVTSNAAGWWRLGADLADAGWSVVAPDLRGHGGSRGGGDYRLSSYAADVIALGERWDGVVGHSLGGAVALVAESSSPGWAGRLVLVEPALLTAAVDPEQAVAWLMESYEQPPTVEAVAAANPAWDRRDVAARVAALQACDPAVVRATVYDNPDWNLLDRAAALEVPTTVVGGDPENGGIVPVAVGEWLAGRSEHIDYVMMRGAGHSMYRDPAHYGEFLEIVAGALEG
jgi:pimeloyl-ACP methyl ester carboxylesterase